MKFSIKEKIVNLKEHIINMIRIYPLTMILIYICTLILTFLVNSDYMESDAILHILEFLIIWIFGAFLTENLKFKSLKNRIILYIITAIISGVFTFAFEFTDLICRILICYLVTTGAMSLYLLINQSKKDISEYALKVSINFIKVSFIYSILSLGIALIVFVFNILILNIETKYIFNIEIFILGVYLVPQLIYSLINVEEEVSKFFQKVIKFVLMPFVVAVFTIIYIYMLKILILREIPKNQIYRISLSLFIIGGFIWTVMQYFKDESIMYRISTKLPLVFSPFILLQVYAISVRIGENGLTPARYLCIILIIIEICYILIYLFRKNNIKELILVANVFLIISMLIPGINMYDMSLKSQIKNLNIYKVEREYTNKEREKISGAYYYLRSDEKGKKYIEDTYTEKDIKKIKELVGYDKFIEKNTYKHITLNKTDEIDISGYNKIQQMSSSNYGNSNNLKDTFKEVNFKNNNYKDIIKADITKEIMEYIKNENGKVISIQLDDKKIIIYSMSMGYNESEDIVQNYYISAYLLEK